MYKGRSECRYIPKGGSVFREIKAIKENEIDEQMYYEDLVEDSFNEDILKSLKRILIKITKAS